MVDAGEEHHAPSPRVIGVWGLGLKVIGLQGLGLRVTGLQGLGFRG